MDSASIVLIVGQLVTFATLIFTAWSARRREALLREWELEDRAAVALKVVEGSTILSERHAAITQAIAENTTQTSRAATAAHEAYQEANQVNVKIANLNARILEENTRPNP